MRRRHNKKEIHCRPASPALSLSVSVSPAVICSYNLPQSVFFVQSLILSLFALRVCCVSRKCCIERENKFARVRHASLSSVASVSVAKRSQLVSVMFACLHSRLTILYGISVRPSVRLSVRSLLQYCVESVV